MKEVIAGGMLVLSGLWMYFSFDEKLDNRQLQMRQEIREQFDKFERRMDVMNRDIGEIKEMVYNIRNKSY